MILKSIMATTNVDRHGDKLTKEVLKRMIEQTMSNRAIPITGQHDRTIPPLGKIIEARIELLDDGEHAIITEGEIFNNRKEIVLADGSKVIEINSTGDSRPFAFHGCDRGEELSIGIDYRNIDSINDIKSLYTAILGYDVEIFNLKRKEFIPLSELLIIFPSLLFAYLAGKITKNVLDRIASDLSNTIIKYYDLSKRLIVEWIKKSKPTGEPKRIVFIMKGNPTIEMVATTNDVDMIICALSSNNLKEIIRRVSDIEKSLNIDKIQFILSDNGEWEFNYILTKKGSVIGTREAISRRDEIIKLVQDGELTGMSIGFTSNIKKSKKK